MIKLHRDDKEVMQSLDRTPYCSTAAIDAASSVLNEIVACLQSLNITIEQVRFHFLTHLL